MAAVATEPHTTSEKDALYLKDAPILYDEKHYVHRVRLGDQPEALVPNVSNCYNKRFNANNLYLIIQTK